MSKVSERGVVTSESLIQAGREIRKMVIANMKPAERLAGLAPEERLAGLSPTERLAGLTPEQLVELRKHIDAYLQQSKAQPEAP